MDGELTGAGQPRAAGTASRSAIPADSARAGMEMMTAGHAATAAVAAGGKPGGGCVDWRPAKNRPTLRST